MELALSIATILGGLSAIWFFYDKRREVAAFFKLKGSLSVNPLDIPDEEFEFLAAKRAILEQSRYLPTNAREEEICRSLVNHGVLEKGMRRYRLSAAGKKMLRARKQRER